MFLHKKDKGTGKFGEDISVKFLKKKKYKILERNWYNKIGKRLGEIDIICGKGDRIVFVEVKTREMSQNVSVIPEEKITPSKLQKIQRAAEYYITENELWKSDWQIDAVSVYVENGKVKKIDHIENIFF